MDINEFVKGLNDPRLKESIRKLPRLDAALKSSSSAMLLEMSERFDCLEDMEDYLERAIHDEAPSLLRDGKVIKEGFDEQVDNLRLALKNGKSWITEIFF